MKLTQLLERTEYTLVQGSLDKEIESLVYDSRKAGKNSLFVCISGTVSDAHDFIPQVLAAGACAIVVEKDVEVAPDVTVLKVSDARLALACLSAAWFGYPAEKLKTIGVTGTKGKTTTTYMVKSILEKSGFRTGLIGTIEIIIGDERIPASNTTPESFLVQEYFRRMVDAGCDSVVMEVSSQGLMLHRVSGFLFDYGIFTNLEPDHIGPKEHKDFQDYMHCKSLLFRQCREGIVNADSEYLAGILEGHTCALTTYGYGESADLRAEDVRLVTKPGVLGVAYHVTGQMDFEVEVDVPGSFSVYNSLTAIAICRHFGVNTEAIKDALKEIRVKGRIEILPVSDCFTVMIDYAHNAMSLESLLSSLRAYQPKRLVCLFGCGGNRDKARRYEMGEVSSKMADFTVITSDNPRFEEPMDIIQDIVIGVKKGPGEYVVVPDRKEAIRYCFDHAREGDVIVLAGKGHEDYQEIKGVKYHMDERELVRDVLQEGNYTWRFLWR